MCSCFDLHRSGHSKDAKVCLLLRAKATNCRLCLHRSSRPTSEKVEQMALTDSHLKELVAREILNIFKPQYSAEGYCIKVNVIVALSNKRSWSTDEIVGGVEYGLSEGWFQNGPKVTLRLTNLGLREIEAVLAA